MALPAWPVATHAPQQDSFQLLRMLDPVATEMEGGNIRQRPRPGDNVGQIGQVIWLTMSEHDTVVAWIKNTLGNGTGRFTMDVWLGSNFVNKVCQFVKPGSNIKYLYLTTEVVAMAMTLRVYDV